MIEEILKNEGLSDWTIKSESGAGGLVLFNSKTILLGEKANFAMFLHEVAHAITLQGHTGLFADKFTELVDKYMSKNHILLHEEDDKY